MSNYTMLSIYGRVRVSLKLEASWEIFSRMAPEANRFNSFLRILENAISLEKNKQTKKQQELVWKFIEKHMKIHGTKVPWPAAKENKCCFFMIAKPLAKSLADR